MENILKAEHFLKREVTSSLKPVIPTYKLVPLHCINDKAVAQASLGSFLRQEGGHTRISPPLHYCRLSWLEWKHPQQETVKKKARNFGKHHFWGNEMRKRKPVTHIWLERNEVWGSYTDSSFPLQCPSSKRFFSSHCCWYPLERN